MPAGGGPFLYVVNCQAHFTCRVSTVCSRACLRLIVKKEEKRKKKKRPAFLTQ